MGNATDARRRYQHATQILDDANGIVQLARLAQSVAHASEPKGALVVASTRAAPNRIGMISGSFNPLTRAHVALADAALDAGRLDMIVWLIPVVAINKAGVERASLVDRLAQMRAFADWRGDALAVVNRGLYVEQADIVRSLAPKYDELVMIVGFDKIVQILDPVYYTDREAALDLLFSRVKALVAPRGGEDEVALDALLARPENRRYRAHIAYCPLPRRFQGDSSTKARAAAAQGKDGVSRAWRLLAPEGRALAALPDAYSPTAGEATPDRYIQRQELIAQLAAQSVATNVARRRISELLRQLATDDPDNALSARALRVQVPET